MRRERTLEWKDSVAIQLIQATTEDIPKLTKVMTLAFDDDAQKHLGTPKGGPPGYDNGDFFRKWMPYEESVTYKIVTEGKTIGGIIVWIYTHGRNVLGTIFVDHALSSGFEYVGWHCDEYNFGSIGVAEKVGFKLERKYIQYYACASEAHHLEETAQAHFMAKRYKEAIESYEKFFATPPEELRKWLREILPQELGTHYFRVAYAKAALGEHNGALKYLEKAVDNGWLHMDFLMSCKEFECMHGTFAWNSMLKKIRKKLNKR